MKFFVLGSFSAKNIIKTVFSEFGLIVAWLIFHFFFQLKSNEKLLEQKLCKSLFNLKYTLGPVHDFVSFKIKTNL